MILTINNTFRKISKIYKNNTISYRMLISDTNLFSLFNSVVTWNENSMYVLSIIQINSSKLNTTLECSHTVTSKDRQIKKFIFITSCPHRSSLYFERRWSSMAPHGMGLRVTFLLLQQPVVAGDRTGVHTFIV